MNNASTKNYFIKNVIFKFLSLKDQNIHDLNWIRVRLYEEKKEKKPKAIKFK
jgi:hypothetical protein